MGVLDRFLNAMKLNDNDGFDDDDFLDDEMDDFEEEAPKKRFFKKQNEEDDLGDLDMDEKVPSGKEKSKAKSFQKSGSTSSPRPYSTSSAKTSNSGKISQMRTTKKSVAGMEVCVIKPRSMEDTREITDTLLANCTVVLNMEGLDVDIAIRCNGEYSYKIVNPILFYTNVCGNVEEEYRRSEIDSMLKTELLTALQPAFAQISDMGIRYSALPGHTMEIADALNAVLSKKWAELRGIEVSSFGVNSVTASKEDEEMIKQLQKTAVLRNPNMAAATLVGAQGDAMKAAASNPNGAMAGFMGMGMVQNAMGTDAQSLFAMGQQQQPASQQQAAQQQSQPAQTDNTAAVSQSEKSGWICECGKSNTGKFCIECGKPKPQPVLGWTCSCGTVNKGKFCMECGAKKPAEEPLYRCDKCGWEPDDPKNPPKFCPECGDPFDDNDIV